MGVGRSFVKRTVVFVWNGKSEGYCYRGKPGFFPEAQDICFRELFIQGIGGMSNGVFKILAKDKNISRCLSEHQQERNIVFVRYAGLEYTAGEKQDRLTARDLLGTSI